jgi:hypothetical protein
MRNFMVDLESGPQEGQLSIVKSMANTNRSMEAIQRQMLSLKNYLSASCNLHFETLVADFIKSDKLTQGDTALEGGGEWLMTGIVSFQFDHQTMLHRTVHLYPFTLNPRDE